MRIYELGFIMKPDLPEPDAEQALGMVRQALTDGGATIDKVDDWGKRRLAYRVRGFWHGRYVFIQYSTEDGSKLTREVERRLRVSDSIIKFMTVRIDEDLKRLKKMQERRAKRAPKLAPRPSRTPEEKPKAPGQPETKDATGPKEPAPAAAEPPKEAEPSTPEPAKEPEPVKEPEPAAPEPPKEAEAKEAAAAPAESAEEASPTPPSAAEASEAPPADAGS